jgi:integrase
MASEKLTKRAIERLGAPTADGRQRLVWDAELKGFGVLVSGKTTAKTFVVQRRLAGGITRRVTVGAVNVFADVDAARARAREILAEMYAGRDPKAERRRAARRATTLRATLDAYLAARKDLKPRSAVDYRNQVERYLAPWLDLALRDISPEMVERRHQQIAAEVKKRAGADGRRGGGPTTGAATANMTFRAFRALWNFAAERDAELPPNPVRRLKRAWYPVPRRERLVRAEDLPRFRAAVDALPNRTARDFIRMLLFTGLRRNEAAALRWDEVDLAGRVIRSPAARTKSGKRLDLPMSSVVRDILIARRSLGDDRGWVFGADARSGHIEEPRPSLDEIARATGITVSCHDLRRTYITVAEGTDISPLALKALVNHALGGDVTSGYIQMTVDRLRGPAQRVADRMMQLCGIEPSPEGVARIG